MRLKNACPLLAVFVVCAAAYALTGFRLPAPAEEPAAAEVSEIAEVSGTGLPEASPEADAPEEVPVTEPVVEPAAEAAVETPAEEASAEDFHEEAPEPVNEGEDQMSAAPVRWTLGEVEPDYFADALFIGDSRTVGLSEYCEELDARADFFAKISLTVNNALDLAFVKTPEGKKSVDELLGDGRQYRKIYVMLGLNEIGSGTDASFAEDYRRMLERIREKQPDAQIMIQGIMHVTKNKSDNDRYFNNPRIDARNAAVAALSDAEQGIWYLDLNEALDDEEGNLTAALSFDDVHLKATSYALWYDYLLRHGVTQETEGAEDVPGNDL